MCAVNDLEGNRQSNSPQADRAFVYSIIALIILGIVVFASFAVYW